MYSDFPQSRFDKPDGQSIVKVFCIFGVDGKGRYGPEIFPFGIVGFCYLGRNLFAPDLVPLFIILSEYPVCAFTPDLVPLFIILLE